jgi:hypothetical protein
MHTGIVTGFQILVQVIFSSFRAAIQLIPAHKQAMHVTAESAIAVSKDANNSD